MAATSATPSSHDLTTGALARLVEPGVRHLGTAAARLALVGAVIGGVTAGLLGTGDIVGSTCSASSWR